MAESEREEIKLLEEDYFSTQDDVKNDTFEDELYGNLIDRQDMDYNELKSLHDESQKRLKVLSQENQVLKQQNIILKKNISCLYLTAKEEIQRKDAQLKSFQEKEIKHMKIQAQKQQNIQENKSMPDQ